MGKLPWQSWGGVGWKRGLAGHANWKCLRWHPARVISKLIAGVWPGLDAEMVRAEIITQGCSQAGRVKFIKAIRYVSGWLSLLSPL